MGDHARWSDELIAYHIIGAFPSFSCGNIQRLPLDICIVMKKCHIRTLKSDGTRDVELVF
jgi:hypothetical protein